MRGPGWRQRLRARAEASPAYRWWVLWVVLAGLLGTNILFTVFVVALPQVACDLGHLHCRTGQNVNVSAVTWVVTGPMLAFGVIAPLAGRASDLWGHRRLYLAGLVLEIVVAVASAAAPDVGVLIVARTLGGLLGASIGAASMALVLGAFSREDRVTALGWWSLVGAGGPVLGVAVGGPLIEHFGWRWLFVMQVPVLVAALALAAAVLPPRAAGRAAPVAQGRRSARMDWAGAGTVGVAVGAFLLALNRGPEWGWTSPGVVGCFAVAVVGTGIFSAVERRAGDPVFPLHYLRRRNVVFPLTAQACANFAYLGAFFLAPLLLENVFGYGEGAAGFLSLPRPVVFSAIAPVAGYVAVRIGERTSAVVGTAAVVASMVVFALAGPHTGVAAVEVAFVLSGVGLGVSSPSLSATIANEFSAEELGTASAAQQLVNQVGTVAGIQVMQTVQAAAAHGQRGWGLLSSFHLAYVVGGVVALVGVAAAALLRSTVRAVPALDVFEALDATERPPVVEGEIGDVVGGELRLGSS